MKHGDTISIVKASGEVMPFFAEKLKRSLLKSGASKEQAESILSQVQKSLYPGISTKKIYEHAYQLLRNSSRPLAARYNLKRAIMELGPSGFPFEKYIAAIFQSQGYSVQTGVIAEGRCVNHEVDVIAEQDNKHFMVECKFHNQPGIACDVKIPLYVQARFKDVEAVWITLPGHDMKLHKGWLVTNTRFTSDAIQYGVCAGLNLLGWDYPSGTSLNKQIDESCLYPITCLTSLSKNEKQNLLNNRVVLCKEICANNDLLRQAHISIAKIDFVVEESYQLCKAIQ